MEIPKWKIPKRNSSKMEYSDYTIEIDSIKENDIKTNIKEKTLVIIIPLEII